VPGYLSVLSTASRMSSRTDTSSVRVSCRTSSIRRQACSSCWPRRCWWMKSGFRYDALLQPSGSTQMRWKAGLYPGKYQDKRRIRERRALLIVGSDLVLLICRSGIYGVCHSSGTGAPAGASETWGDRPGMRVVKTTPSCLPSRSEARQARSRRRPPPTASTPDVTPG
jgi:hypothetical protein